MISHLVLMTGLTDRTIRNYISSGILQGEKINGLWHFTAEQVEQFICHPAVRPSILAKQHSCVYDFLLNQHLGEITDSVIYNNINIRHNDTILRAEFNRRQFIFQRFGFAVRPVKNESVLLFCRIALMLKPELEDFQSIANKALGIQGGAI